ncbi:MAG: amidohydrolase [Clostridia bacterium]|nr:amidohydrolase [Clostridia bacterium]
MKTVLQNGKLYVKRGVFAQAALVEDGVIRRVGTNEEVLAAAGADAEHIDLEGKTVIPGLNDCHLHLELVGETLAQVDLNGATSVDEIVERCKKFMAENPELVKHGVVGVGWNQDFFTGDKVPPEKWQLDRITTEVPVGLVRACRHIVATNSRAIEMLGLRGDAQPYEGGKVVIGADGEPNGVFCENAVSHVQALIPSFSFEQQTDLLGRAMDYATAHGITSVQSNDAGMAMDTPRALRMLHAVFDSGKGKLRYRHQVCCKSVEELEAFLASDEYKERATRYDARLTLGPLKLFKDGSLGARTALMRREYHDDPGNFGVESMSDELQDAFCALADAHGLQVVTHVIGDAAVEKTINAYEKVLKNGKNPLRHALIHCQITDRAQLERIAKLNLVTYFQPIFLDYDIHTVEDRVGRELASTSYAFETLHKLGAPVAYGTDAPVENCNPFPNIYCAVTRQDKTGFPAGGLFPEERVDVETAIDAYTIGSAYAEFAESVKGRIAEGYYADLVVLDRDIFTCPAREIMDILPVLTMVDGTVVYRK